jgi:hypothetical protein
VREKGHGQKGHPEGFLCDNGTLNIDCINVNISVLTLVCNFIRLWTTGNRLKGIKDLMIFHNTEYKIMPK